MTSHPLLSTGLRPLFDLIPWNNRLLFEPPSLTWLQQQFQFNQLTPNSYLESWGKNINSCHKDKICQRGCQENFNCTSDSGITTNLHYWWGQFVMLNQGGSKCHEFYVLHSLVRVFPQGTSSTWQGDCSVCSTSQSAFGAQRGFGCWLQLMHCNSLLHCVWVFLTWGPKLRVQCQGTVWVKVESQGESVELKIRA